MADQNMRLRVVLDLVDKAMAPLKRIGQGSKETAATLKAARDQLKQLNQTQKDVGSFQTARTGLADTAAKLQAARDQVRQLAASHAQAGPPTKAMAQQMAAARTAASQLDTKFDAQRISVQQLRDKLSAAGISTRNLASHDVQLRSSIAATTAKIQAQTNALKLSADTQKKASAIKGAQQANVSERGNARGALFDGVAMAAALATPIKMAVEFESSMADVAKVMDFGDDKNGLEKMSQAALDMSKRLPMAAKDIAQIMALGGQSGLSADDILGSDGKVGFAEHAVKMGVAFGMTAEEAGNSMAKMKSAFGMSIPEVAELTDKINLLGNTGAASEKQILNIVTRVGPLGGVAGVASGEIAALGSTLAGMGVQEEVAATGIQNFMLALTAGGSATKKQRAMLSDLGLESTEVAKSMQSDATGTMLKVLESVKKLPKHEQAAALTELFGKESIKAIAPMLTQLDTLKENFQKVGDSSRYANAVNDEYATRAATTANQLQLAKNQTAAMAITLGNAMLPALNDAIKAFIPWMDRLSGMAQASPGVTKAIVMVVGGLMLFKIAAIAGAYAFTFVRGALLSVQATMLAARMGWMLYTGAMVAGSTASRAAIVISKALTVAQWLFNAAMTANPIGLVIVAIAALVAVGVLLYRNWDAVSAAGRSIWGSFTAWLSSLWNGFVAVAASIWGRITTAVSGLISGGVSAWMQALLNFSPLGILWSAITMALGALGIQVPEQFRSLGGFIVDGLIGGITNKLAALKDTVVGAATAVAGWFKEKLGIASPSKVFTEFGGWISEGAAVGMEKGQAAVRTAALAVAGAALVPVAQADGPIVDPGGAGAMPLVSSGTPMAPSLSAAPAAGGGSAISITINAAPGMDAQAIARAVAAEMDKRERAAGARRRSGLYDQN